jgi:PAS domain S-box-containing protein
VNLSGASQLGYAIDELEGQSVLKVFHEDDRQAVTEQLKICLQSPWQVHHWKFPEVRKDGSLLRVEEYVRAVIGPGGDLSVFITCQDITDRKRAEEELGIVRAELERQVEERAVELARADEQLKADITVRREGEEALRKARAEMERRIEERTTELVQSNNRLMAEIAERERAETALAMAGKRLNILSGITRHDVLNQLSVLQGILEFSQGFTHDPEGLLRFIAKEKKVAATIERLSTFTKDYQDTGVKAPEWQNVQNSIRSATGALPTGNIRVDAELENLEIFADPLLEMVFYNLIDNALGHGGEKITTIRFSSHESDRGMIIVCEDDGAGISGEAKKHLFERGLGENTGLGLYLVREILSITGITISETGEPGKGARFEIFVPEGTYRFMKIND